MNSVLEIANSKPMYLLAIGVVLFILIQSMVFLVKSYRRGIKIGMDRKILNKTIISSSIFTFVPSIGIFLGVIALSGSLGITVPWMRLSVIGALHYEVMAADVAAKSIGISELSANSITNEAFVTIIFIMTIGIIWGAVFCLFGLKKYNKGIKKSTSKDNRWGQILFNAMFIGMVSAFIGQGAASMRRGNYVDIIVILISGITMAVLTYFIEKKNQKWLDSFALSFSMIIAMLVAVIIG